jgi:2-phospho-L-lactate guanylyltransferase
MPGSLAPPAVAVLVPVKAFHLAKARLADVLGAEERAALARRMAGRVLHAAGPLPAAVVCDDEAVAAWATAHGATVLWRPGRGLNPAVQEAVAALGDAGYARVIVAHADLPLATELGWVAGFVGVTIVPDRRDDGTNVLSVPTRSGFEFAYGSGSYRRHAGEARRRRLAVRVVRDRPLGWDVDIAEDLAPLAALAHSPAEA